VLTPNRPPHRREKFLLHIRFAFEATPYFPWRNTVNRPTLSSQSQQRVRKRAVWGNHHTLTYVTPLGHVSVLVSLHCACITPLFPYPQKPLTLNPKP